jgi:hypothetical protein
MGEFGGKDRVISHRSEVAEILTPIANFETPLLRVRTPRGAKYVLGSYRGQVGVMKFNALKLYSAPGNQAPAETSVYLYRRGPNDEFSDGIRRIPYASFFDLDESQQRDERFVNQLTYDLGNQENEYGESEVIPGYEFMEDYFLELRVLSPVVVNLTVPETRLEFNIEEFSV